MKHVALFFNINHFITACLFCTFLFSNICFAVPYEGDIKEVAVGRNHTCAVTIDSKLYCWGYNSSGQLGDGTNTNKTTPTEVPLSNVKTVSLGAYHTCAITADSKLYCWGSNASGQLGDNTNTNKTTPIEVPLSNVKAVSLGEYHTCAITTDSKLYCWGANGSGRLGDGTEIIKSTPTEITSLSNAENISLGASHTCAVTSNSKLYCWGNNDYGKLGDGTMEHRFLPVLIHETEDNVNSVALGTQHSCIIGANSKLYCFGYNSSGQLGDGSASDIHFPTIEIMQGIKNVSLGDAYTCAITTDSRLYCWGDNSAGQLGDGTNTRRYAPAELLFSNARGVSGGGEHTCATTNDYQLYCWGANGYGQLGDGTNSNKNTPTQIFSGGCTTDTDSDGTPDCYDECPTDPNKIEPGVCDCGNEEVPGCGVIACSADPLYSEIGNSCDTGKLGECKAGVYICKDDAVTCNQQKDATVEICGDGKDNDCDGEVDEGCIVDLCPEDPNKIEPGVCGCGIPDVDSDSDGVLDCNDGCPDDPKNKELTPPVEGCFVNKSEVPEKYDPKVEPNQIVTPKEKLLPVYVIKKSNKVVLYLERFSGAAFKKLENLTALFDIQMAQKKTTYRYEVRIASRNKKTGYRATTTKKLKSSKNSFNLKLKKNTVYTIKYRVVIKQGKKEKATKWSKAVKVKR